jgi:mycofactocin system glycosyltransferase
MDGREITVQGAAGAIVADRLLETNIALPVLSACDRAPAPELTVVVPIRDRSRRLDRALVALRGLRVIVIDDASRDPAAIRAVARAHSAEVVHLHRNVGPAAARNAGLERVRTPYIAFVDSDVVVAADTLLGLTAHFADPRVALVAPHVRGRAVNARPRWLERYEESLPALGLGERPGVVRPGAAVAWLPGACLVGRTDRLADGFDGRMWVGEDVDLVWRLVAGGHRVRYDPAFEAFHDVRTSLSGWMGRKFSYGTGGAALAERHPDNVVTAILSPSMGLAALAVLARRRWSTPVVLAGTAWAIRALTRSFPDVPERRGLAVRLSLRGLGWTLRQESALVLRHWWPLAFLSALRSRTARRVVVSAMVVDVIATRFERPGLDPLQTFVGRRLDDVAYGAGLWWGAIRAGSLRCLKLRWLRGKTNGHLETQRGGPGMSHRAAESRRDTWCPSRGASWGVGMAARPATVAQLVTLGYDMVVGVGEDC